MGDFPRLNLDSSAKGKAMLRFIDGFDHYATADIGLKWPLTSGVFTIQSTAGRNGSGAVRFSVSGSQSLRRGFDNQATWIVGLAFKIDALPNGANMTFLRILDASTTQLELSVNSASKLVVTRNGTTIGTGTTTIVANVFYFVEFMATISSSVTAGTCGVHLGGVSEIAIAGGTNTKNTSNAFASVIEIGSTSGPGTFLWIDDLYICDSTGSPNNTYLGDVRVETIFPNAAGTSTSFTPTSGANYTCVNQVVEDGDTSYVSSATVNNIDTYLFASLATTPTTVFGLQTDVTSRKDDAGSRQVAAVVRHAGTDYIGATIGLADNYTLASEIRETNPATGSAWTATTVNALEAGIKLVG